MEDRWVMLLSPILYEETGRVLYNIGYKDVLRMKRLIFPRGTSETFLEVGNEGNRALERLQNGSCFRQQ